MTTTPPAPPTHHPAPAAPNRLAAAAQAVTDRFNRRGLSSREFWLMTVMGIFAFIAIFFLLFIAGGQPLANLPKSTFPTNGTTIIVIANLVFLAWPLIKAIRQRDLGRGIAVVAIVILLLLLPFVFRLSAMTGIAQGLWALRVLGPVAIVLNVILAFRLISYDLENPAVVSGTADVERVQRELVEAQTAAGNRAREAQAAVTEVTRLQSLRDTAAAALTAAEAALAQAKITEEASDEAQAETQAKELLARLVEKRDKVKSRIAHLKAALKDAKPAEKLGLKQRLKDATDRLSSIELDILEAQETLEDATDARTASATTLAVANAQAARDSAFNADKEAQDSLNAGIKARETAEIAARSAGEVVSQSQEELLEVSNCLHEAMQASQRDGRGFIFWTVILFITTLLFYTSWYGWVYDRAAGH